MQVIFILKKGVGKCTTLQWRTMHVTSAMLCTSMMVDEAMAKCNCITNMIWMVLASK